MSRESICTVKGLILPHLEFDPIEGSVLEPEDTSEIIGTHGTHIDTVVRLARNGRFIGGNPLLDGFFFLNANMNYQAWHGTHTGRLLAQLPPSKSNAFQKAVDYAETAQGYDYVEELDANTINVDSGVVIAFNAQILATRGIEVWVSNDDDLAPELIIPSAPALETVHSIYPVGEIAALSLKNALSKN